MLDPIGVNIPPVSNPARLFEALFVNADKTSIQQERERLRHRGSVLDALHDSAKSMGGKLNVSDRDKLDQYLTSVRDVEQRLQMSQEWLDRPKPKAPIKPIRDEERMQIEEMPLMYDLLVLALQTDSTRVATFEIPMGFKTSELDLDWIPTTAFPIMGRKRDDSSSYERSRNTSWNNSAAS